MTPSEEASPAVGDALLGKVIAGNFRIDRLIGSGAMGNVYQAEQLSLGKAVAVKVLHPHLMSDEKLIRRFQREAKSASRLNHVNSIQIIDSGRDAEGALYIAMELLTGRDLSQVIRDEFPLPVPRVIRIMSQVLTALDEAHAQGVIHRDLKPSNIMLIERRGESDFVKVCDYGIAKAQFDESAAESQMLTIQGLVCGTPEYMSPEQARGEPLDGRTDLYSAAVILYHMVTGDIPFRAATPIGIVSRHLSEAPVVPSSRRPDPSIPPDLDDLILRGLAKSRELRPPSAAAFREELENIGAGRVGKRLRGDRDTVPSTPQAISAEGHTVAMAAVSASGRRTRAGRPLALGLLLVSGAGLAATVLLRRGPGAGSTGTSLATVASTGPLLAAAPVEPSAAAPPVAAPEAPPVAEGVLDPARPAPPALALALHGPKAAVTAKATPSSKGKAAMTRRSGETAPVVEGRGGVPAKPATTVAVPAQPATASAGTAEVKPILERASAPTPREIVTDGERLLSHGEVESACRRGEEAKKLDSRLTTVYKFLGKCYMRAGDPVRAKENYRRYLELAPGAADAMFIESIVK